MNTEIAARIILIVTGLFFLWESFTYFAKRKLVATIGLGWGFISLLLIVVGAVPGLCDFAGYIQWPTLLTAFLLGFFGMLGVFFLSISISKLIMKNQELAMQVSLLNQENERILRKLAILPEKMEEEHPAPPIKEEEL